MRNHAQILLVFFFLGGRAFGVDALEQTNFIADGCVSQLTEEEMTNIQALQEKLTPSIDMETLTRLEDYLVAIKEGKGRHQIFLDEAMTQLALKIHSVATQKNLNDAREIFNWIKLMTQNYLAILRSSERFFWHEYNARVYLLNSVSWSSFCSIVNDHCCMSRDHELRLRDWDSGDIYENERLIRYVAHLFWHYRDVDLVDAENKKKALANAREVYLLGEWVGLNLLRGNLETIANKFPGCYMIKIFIDDYEQCNSAIFASIKEGMRKRDVKELEWLRPWLKEIPSFHLEQLNDEL